MSEWNFEADVLAELAAINVALKTIVHEIAQSRQAYPGEHAEYVDRLMKKGSEAIDRFTYTSIPIDRLDRFRENAKARYANIVGVGYKAF